MNDAHSITRFWAALWSIARDGQPMLQCLTHTVVEVCGLRCVEAGRVCCVCCVRARARAWVICVRARACVCVVCRAPWALHRPAAPTAPACARLIPPQLRAVAARVTVAHGCSWVQRRVAVRLLRQVRLFYRMTVEDEWQASDSLYQLNVGWVAKTQRLLQRSRY